MSMNILPITADRRGYLSQVLQDLVRSGFSIKTIPIDGCIPRNGLKLTLKLANRETRVRVFVYSVTTSGRSRPHERRVEITTTYKSGLPRSRRYCDVVLGYDTASRKYVGIDSRRLKMGGSTHNASSFFDLEGLSVGSGGFLINPRSVFSQLFPGGIEHHAFFDGARLADYLFNHQEIHSGSFTYGISLGLRGVHASRARSAMGMDYEAVGDSFALFANSKHQSESPRVVESLVSAVENGDFTRIGRRKITPEQLKKLLSYCDEIGVLGEQAVLGRR